MKPTKYAILVGVCLVSNCVIAVAGNYARTIVVQKLGTNNYKVTCRLIYPRTNPSDTYLVDLWGGGTSMPGQYPYGGYVGPDAPNLHLEDPSWPWVFDAVLGPTSLTISRIYYYRLPPGPGEIVYCQGGSRDETTGTNLGTVNITSDLSN